MKDQTEMIIAAAEHLTEAAKSHDAAIEQLGMKVLKLVEDATDDPDGPPPELLSLLSDLFVRLVSQQRQFCEEIQVSMANLIEDCSPPM